jgi:hypothetical protein
MQDSRVSARCLSAGGRRILLIGLGALMLAAVVLAVVDPAVADVVGPNPSGGGPSSTQLGQNAQRQAAALAAAALVIVAMGLAVVRYGAQDHKGLVMAIAGFLVAGMFVFKPEKVVAFGDKLVNALL